MNLNNQAQIQVQQAADQNAVMQFGINGANFTGMNEEQGIIGQRDIYRGTQASGRGRGAPIRNAPGRPPLNNRRPNQLGRTTEEENKAPTSLAAASQQLGGFNLSGTHIGGTTFTNSTKESSQIASESQKSTGHVAKGRSIRKRPLTLNNALPPKEEKKAEVSLELNATGLVRRQTTQQLAKQHPSASAGRHLGLSSSKNRLVRDIQQFDDFNDEVELGCFGNAMHERLPRENVAKKEIDQRLAKGRKLLGKNGPLSSQGLNQNNVGGMEIQATGLQLALQGSDLTKLTHSRYGSLSQTPRNVLQDSALRITQSGIPRRTKPVLAKGTVNLNTIPLGQTQSQRDIRIGSASTVQERRQLNMKPLAAAQRPPLRRNHQDPVQPDALDSFVADMAPQIRHLGAPPGKLRAPISRRATDIATGSLPLAVHDNDAVIGDMGIFGTQL